MSAEHVVPIREAINDRINASGLYLPNYLDREIGIDMDKTTRLMNIGGIHHLSIVNLSSQEDSPSIAGFDSQGGAFAGATKVVEKNESETTTEDVDMGGDMKAGQWKSIKVAIDTEIIAKRALTKGREELNHSSNWAPTINKTVRGEVVNLGFKNSLKPSTSIYDYGCDAFALSTAFLSVYQATQPDRVSQLYAILNTFYFLLTQSPKALGILVPQARFDLLYSIHPGRAALSQLRGRTTYRTLIAPMEKEEE